MSITVGGGLGVRISGGIVVGPSVGVSLSGNDYVNFLLRDDFTTAEAAPLASPRTAEPGPGTLTLVQTDGQFSIANGKLNFPAQASAAWGDQGFYGGIQSRSAGRIVVGRFNFGALGQAGLGWDDDSGLVLSVASSRWALSTNSAVLDIRLGTSASIELNSSGISTATDYYFALVMRATGLLALIRGGAYSNWTLAWVDASNTTATMYPVFSNFSAAGTLDTFRVRDLPAPFNTDYGLATDRLAGAVSAGTTFTHEANCVIEWTQTTLPSAGGTTVHFRRQDANNNWYIQIQGTDFYLAERVAGSASTRAQALGVLSDGHRIVIVADGTTIRGYSNNVLRWTYSSASNFATETDGRLDALGTGAAVSDVVAWPRTLTGAAATILDQSVA